MENKNLENARDELWSKIKEIRGVNSIAIKPIFTDPISLGFVVSVDPRWCRELIKIPEKICGIPVEIHREALGQK